MPVPAGFRLTYRGQEVSVQSTYTYLGVVLHSTKGLGGAGTSLAASGSKAMHALLTRLRRANLTQFEMKGRMFDVLVEPVMSYASHVWGPSVCHKLLGRPFATAAEQVHMSYLRVMTGVGKAASHDVLYRDLHRVPIMHHWIALAARWWNRLAKRGAEPQPGIAHHAWRSDLALLLSGCIDCWSYHLLSTLEALGLVESHQWRPSAGATMHALQELQWDEQCVVSALMSRLKVGWQQAEAGLDPRTAPSQGLAKLTHSSWVYPFDPGIAGFTRENAPSYTRLCLPYVVLRNMAQLRMGWAHLEVQEGRARRPPVPRGRRTCKVCCGQDSRSAWRRLVLARTGSHEIVEDLRHFLLECPAYDALRDECAAFPPTWRLLTSSATSAASAMVEIFASIGQAALARTLFQMKVSRAELLGLQGCI